MKDLTGVTLTLRTELTRLDTVYSPEGNYTYAYGDLDRPAKLNRPNGLTTTYGYDPAGNLSLVENTKPKGDLVSETTYDVDTAGQLVTSTRTGEKGPIVTTYEYDANGRLVYAEGPRGDEEDQEEEGKPEGTDEATGENTAPSPNGKGAGKGSSATSADETSSDAESQTAEEESAEDEWLTTEYIHDAAGRLVEVYQDGGPNREKYTDYTYDGDGNRVGLVAHVEEPGDNGLHLGWYKADKVKDGDLPGNGHGNGNGGGNGNAGGNGNGNSGGNGNAGVNGNGNAGGNGNGQDNSGSANVPPGQAKKDAPEGSKGNGKGQAKGGKSDIPGRSGEIHGKGKAKGHEKSNRNNKNKVYDLELNYVNDILAPLPEVLATYDEQGQPRDTFVYGLQRLTGIASDGNSIVYVYDGLGNVRQLADAQGAVFDRYAYSPYGLPAANGRLNPSQKLNDGNTFGFGGQDHDPVFGQVYLRARYYTPGLGRFTAPDPLVVTGLDLPGMSPYAYAQDNPLSYLDPSGLIGQKLNRGLDFTYAAMVTGLSVVGAAMSVVMLATTPVGWAGFAVLAVLTASHFIGAVHDVSAFSQGNYDEIGTGDPLYKWAGEVGGAAGEYILAGTEGLAWMGSVSAAPPGSRVPRNSAISTPYGPAAQEDSAAALAARQQVDQGELLYRKGNFGEQRVLEAQHWAMENPSNPEYDSIYGVPYTGKADYIVGGELRPNEPFITREAPPIYPNPGGGIEVVTEPRAVRLRFFHMPD